MQMSSSDYSTDSSSVIRSVSSPLVRNVFSGTQRKEISLFCIQQLYENDFHVLEIILIPVSNENAKLCHRQAMEMMKELGVESVSDLNYLSDADIQVWSVQVFILSIFHTRFRGRIIDFFAGCRMMHIHTNMAVSVSSIVRSLQL